VVEIENEKQLQW